MAKLPDRLQIALESDCAEELNGIIQEHREADFDQLRRLLSTGSDVDSRHRTRALYALGRWGDKRAVGDILQALPVLDERGRIAAMDALGRLESAEALQAILEHSADPSPHVRKFAIHALGKFAQPLAREKLVEMSEQDPDPNLRTLAMEYLHRNQ